MEQVFEFIKEHNMIHAQDCVVAGVSGGADSLCLLFVLLEFQKEIDFQIEVVHVEHGIRGAESLEDADFVERICKERNLSFHIYRYDVPQAAAAARISVEEAARRCRYEAFDKAAGQYGGTKIAVAHNEDDQAETILWNLVRGSGVKGLCGMRPVNGQVIRPLLKTTRKEIEAYLAGRGVDYRTDSTNLGTDYSRNKLRHQVIPILKEDLNSQAVRHIAEAGERLYKAEEFLVKQSAAAAEKIGRMEDGSAWIRRSSLLREEEIIQEYILKYWMEQLEMGLRDIGAVHIAQLRKLAGGSSGRMLQLPGGRQCRCTGDYLVLGRFWPRETKPGCCELMIPGETRYGKWRIITELLPGEKQIIPENQYTKWLDYDTIKDTVYLRGRKSGDYFYTAGGRKKLKKYLIDEKVLHEERDQIPLVADGAHILWIVGYRISERCKITKDTKMILKIQMVEE